MIMKSKVVFVGAGNMAEAILSGMVAAEFCGAEKIVMADIRPERLKDLEEEYGVCVSTDNGVVQNAEIVVLSVKPQVMAAVLQEIAPFLSEETLIISIAAGIPCSFIEGKCKGRQRVVRVMPNTPALVGQGASALAAGTYADEADVDVAESILRCVGLTVRVQENQLDAVTALSGSGPAYVFYLIEAMLAAAKQMGLAADVAQVLAVQTVAGAARLMQDSGESATTLRERVTSRGGTTAAAIQSFDESAIDSALIKGLLAAKKRSEDLSDG